MFIKISQSISDSMVEKGIIQSENEEICRYGVQQIFSILLNLSTMLSVALFIGMITESILFMAAYIPLRCYAGGYHAKTPLRCYIIFIFTIISVLLLMKYVELTIIVCIVLLIVSAILIFAFSPIEDKNKPLDEIEKKVYRRRAMVAWTVEVLLGVVFFAFKSL